MKLSEIKIIRESASTYDFIVKKWDGNQPDGQYVKPFDVKVTYHVEDLGYSDHPYGEGTAREEHGKSVSVISIESAEVVEVMNEEGDKVLKTFPTGTPVAKIPGWEESSNDWFQHKAEEEVE